MQQSIGPAAFPKEMQLFKHETENTASEALADEQLDLVSGGQGGPHEGDPPPCNPFPKLVERVMTASA
jgi:hypothetical protein